MLLQNVSACLLSSPAMPDRNKSRSGPRQEFEVAYYTKELGQSVQRRLLQAQLARFSENGSVSSSHAEEGHGADVEPQADAAPPQDDRAG